MSSASTSTTSIKKKVTSSAAAKKAEPTKTPPVDLKTAAVVAAIPEPVVEVAEVTPVTPVETSSSPSSEETESASTSLDKQIQEQKKKLAKEEKKEHFSTARVVSQLLRDGINKESLRRIKECEPDGKLYKQCRRWVEFQENPNKEDGTPKKKIVRPFRTQVNQVPSVKKEGKFVQEVKKIELSDEEISSLLENPDAKRQFEERSLYAETKVRFANDAAHLISEFFEWFIRAVAVYVAEKTRDSSLKTLQIETLLKQDLTSDARALSFVTALSRSPAYHRARAAYLNSRLVDAESAAYEKGLKQKKNAAVAKLSKEEKAQKKEEEEKRKLVEKIAKMQLRLEQGPVVKATTASSTPVDRVPTHPFETYIKQIIKSAVLKVFPDCKISSEFKHLLCHALDDFIEIIHTAVGSHREDGDAKTIMCSDVKNILRMFFRAPVYSSEIVIVQEADPEILAALNEKKVSANKARVEAEKAGKPLPPKFTFKLDDVAKVPTRRAVVHVVCPDFDELIATHEANSAARAEQVKNSKK